MCVCVCHHPYLGSSKLSVLYEQWLQCEGHWTESTFFKEIKSTNTHRRRGARRWLTVSELTLKYGSERVALRIKAAKEQGDADVKKTQIRDHPDVPGDPEPHLNSDRDLCFYSSSINHFIMACTIHIQSTCARRLVISKEGLWTYKNSL